MDFHKELNEERERAYTALSLFLKDRTVEKLEEIESSDKEIKDSFKELSEIFDDPILGKEEEKANKAKEFFNKKEEFHV